MVEPFLKLRDVSQMTGIPTWTLARWLRKGVGPQFKRTPTGQYLFRQSEVETWIECLDGPKGEQPDKQDAA